MKKLEKMKDEQDSIIKEGLETLKPYPGENTYFRDQVLRPQPRK